MLLTTGGRGALFWIRFSNSCLSCTFWRCRMSSSVDQRNVSAFRKLEDACSNVNCEEIFCMYGFSVEQIFTCDNGAKVARISYLHYPDSTGPSIGHVYIRTAAAGLADAEARKIAIYETVHDACNFKNSALYPANRILTGQFIIQCNNAIVHQALLIDTFGGETQVIPFGFLVR
jgi:hypothetical protein